MKTKCNVVRDLLPSYLEDLTSEDSNELIISHVQDCSECNEILKDLKASILDESDIKLKPSNNPERKLAQRIWNRIIMFIIASFIIGGFLGILGYHEAIFQEGDPVPLVIGIVKLQNPSNNLIKISSFPERFVIKTKEGYDPFIKLMKDRGWIFEEQIGSGLIFERDKEMLTVGSRMYSKYFRIIEIPSLEKSTKQSN